MSTCLDPETLAAFAEGKLKRRELAAALEHLDTCSHCMSAVEIISMSHDGEARRIRWTPWLAAAAAVVAIAILTALLLPRRSSIARLVSLAPESARIVEPRLAGGFAWAPYRGQNRAAATPAEQPQRWKLIGAAGEIVEEANRAGSPDAEHAAGVALLMMERSDDAIARLRAAAEQTPDEPRRWSDLAAAQYVAARTRERPSFYPQALAACDRALAADATLAEALFNRALILERMGLAQEARVAWSRYLQSDPSSRWADEARQHLAALPQTTGEERFRYDKQKLERAAVDGDTAALIALVDRDRQRARAFGEAEYLGEWGERGDARPLTIARAIGDALVALSGESLLRDAVRSIDSATPAQRARLAAAHVAYRRGRKAYARQELRQAETDLHESARLFESANSPMALVARYYQANIRFDGNDIAGSREALASLLAEANAHPQFAALGANIRWQMVTCAIADGDWASTFPLLEESIATFRRLGERGNEAFVQAMAGSAYINSGQTELGWAAHIRTFGILDADRTGDRLAVAIAETVRLELGAKRFESARALLAVEQSVTAATNNPALISYAHVREALLDVRLGDAAAAARAIAAARTAANRVADPAMRVRAHADVQFAEGSAALRDTPAQAHALLTNAVDHYVETGRHLFLPESLLLRARAAVRLGKRDAAARDLESGVELLERQHPRLAGAVVGTGALDAGRALFEDAIRLCADRGDAAGVFRYFERQRGGEVTLDAFRARLGTSGTAVLALMALPEEVVLLRITSADVRLARTPMARERIAGRDARELYEALIRPAALPEAYALIVIADEPLQNVPFGALHDAERGERLIERMPVAIARNASSLQASSRPAPHTLAAILLPAAGLPEVRPEIDDLRRLYRQSLELPSSRVTLDAVLSTASRADVVHIAGHTTETPVSGETSIDLGGSRVSWRSLAKRRLRRPVVVVLSACETLRPRVQSLSLGAGFLAAGASDVIGTLTPIADADARSLFAAIHRRLAAGDDPAVAVQRAQIESIRANDHAAWQSIALITNCIPERRS